MKDESKLHKLLAVHNEFCAAAGLPENTRPYSVQSRLEEIEKLIMEEVKTEPTKTEDDDIPF